MFLGNGVDKLIVGLGNPGKQYELSRHNTGFMALDFIAEKYGIKITRCRFSGVLGTGRIDGVRVALLKPSTYMNLSGDAVAAAAKYYKLSASDIVVISDDVTLDCGTIRIRPSGSAGGHNGLKSIISHLGEGFARIKIGVGPQKCADLADHVLSRFSAEQRKAVTARFPDVTAALSLVIRGELAEAQAKYN